MCSRHAIFFHSILCLFWMLERINFQLQSILLWKYASKYLLHISLSNVFQGIILKKIFLPLREKKKSSGQHLGNIWQLGRKLSFCMRYVKINAWNEDFTSVFFSGILINATDFKKNYQNKLLPSSMAWATPIIQVLINVFLLLFLLQIERHEVLLLHISFGRSP